MKQSIKAIRDEFYLTARIFAKVRADLDPHVIQNQLGYLNGLLFAMGEPKIDLDDILLQTPKTVSEMRKEGLDYRSDTELGVED